ncbi:MAG: enoyl-CoA hydratase/isomerase family protein [Deltaproteobacteria bacterium]|nr:enoyl-CoA hydratase/isomerase family protein [Deltaproteobacteria bacterium]
MNRVELEVGRDGVAVIRLSSPDGRNTLGIEEIGRFIELVDRVAADGSVRALILAGGENFSAGTDSFEVMRRRLDPGAGGRAYRFFADQKALCDRIRGLRIPTISLVRGLCLGSVLGIAAAADFLITDATTRIEFPEVKVGLVPGNGATWFLPRRMGPAAAKFYALTASSMNGKQAVGLGLAQAYAGDDVEGFLAELRKAEGALDRRRISALLEKKGSTREVLGEGVRELSEKIGRHFRFGKANRGYLGDIFAGLEKAAAEGDVFAQEALAAMRSASAQAVWVTEFLIDTFAQEGLYAEDEARAAELKFAQEMAAGFAHLEGVLGLSKGFVSGEINSHLDRIAVSDAKGFRTSIPATPVSTGCRLAEDAPFTCEGNEYVLPRGAYHCGEKSRVLTPPGDPARAVGFRIELRNSQWSDQRVSDELGVLRSLMETKMGWRMVRRAWLTHPEKFELDMIYPYAWSERPSVSLDLRSFPVIRRFEDGRINPARAIFDQLEARGLLDERRVINIGEDQKDGKNVDVRAYTYREIRREANRLANVLVDMGVAPGDMVVIYMSTDIKGLIAQLAATLVGATYHFVFGAKGPDIVSDTVYNMGAKVIITEDGYRVGDRSRELKKDSVDVALSRYLPKAVFQERLEAATAVLPEELAEEAGGIGAAVSERLAGKVTYDRDAMREFLEVVHEAHIKRIVLSSLDEDAGEELKKALRVRDEAIRRAKARVAAALRDERVFSRYASVLAAALRGVPAEADPGDSGEPWWTDVRALAVELHDRWGEVLDNAGDAVETRHRDWLKNHVRRIAHGIPRPTVETLLSDDHQGSVSEFILRHARRKGVGAGHFESVERQRRVIDLILAAFEQPWERDEKLIVYDRLTKLGLLSRAPLEEGRDILWDDAIRRTENKLKARGADIDEFAAVEMGGGDPAILSYSSGSTGQPKGIISLVGSVVAGGQTMFNSFGLAPHEIHHTSTDYGWIVGPAYALWFPMMEGRSFLLQSFAPTPRRLAQVVEDHRASFLKAGSPIYEAMSKVDGLFEPDKGGFDVRSLQREGAPGICGCAAPYSYPAHARIQAVLGDVAINSLWRTEDFGSQHATFKRRPSVERRCVETYRAELRRLAGTREPEEAVARVRTPIEMDAEHPEILPLPWVNPVIADRLEDENGNRVESPREVTEALITASGRGRKGVIGQLLYRGAQPHRMAWLMGSNEGRRGPARPDAALTAAKYYNHGFTPDWPGKGREGRRLAHDGGDSAYWVRVVYDPESPEDALILDGPEDPVTPRTFYASGRSGNIANVYGHLVNETMFENALNEHTRYFRKVGVTFIHHPTKDRTPVVVVALQPGVQPSQDLVDLVQMTINQKLNPQVKPDVQDIVFLLAEAAGFEGEETFLPMTLTAKIMYELIKFYAGKPLETLQRMKQALLPDEVRAKIRGGDAEFFRASPLFQGMPNLDGLKVKGTLINLLDRIIASREGDKVVTAPFRADAPAADPYADVPDRLVKRLGTPPLRAGIDPVPPYQEAYGIVRNEDGMSMAHRDPALGFRKFVRPTPTPSAGQALVQILYAGATYNVINGITSDPVDVLGDKDHHVLGDAAVGQIVALSPEAEAEGRLAIGQLVIVDPMVFNRQAPTVTLDAQREGHIGGYQGGRDQATLQAFAAFDTGSLIEVPVDMPLPLAATLILNGPTVEHALFSPAKLNLTSEDVLLVHGGSGHTGSLAIDMATALGVPVLTYVLDRKEADLVRSRHPHADLGFILRAEHPEALRAAPAGDPEELAKWQKAVERLVASVPAKYRPTKVLQNAGRGLQAADFRLLRPSPQGSRTDWYSGAFGLYGTFNGYDARLSAAEALGRDGADLRLGENVLVHYGANADAEGRDEPAIAAIAFAARLGARVTVLAETPEQQNWLLRREEVAVRFGKTRIQNVEALREGEGKKKLLWPEHMPDVDEGRFAPDREAHESWPGRDEQTRFTTETVSVVKNALGPYNTNASGLWDAIWDSGRRDHLALNVALVTEQTGRVVYGETISRQTLTYQLAQGWMLQRAILVPANPEELGDAATAREKIVRLAGSHMYEPHEAQAFRDKIDRGLYHLHGPDRVLDADQIPCGFSDQLHGRAPGSTAYRMATNLDGVRSERDLLLARGVRIAEELSLMRLLLHPIGGDGAIATVEFKLNQPKGSNTLRNADLHWFRGDAVKQLRLLFHRIREEDTARAAVLTAEGTRAFVPGQNSDELSVLSDEQITELAALAQETMSAIEGFRIPVVLNLNGLALGGGTELVAAAHYVVASRVARIYLGQPETVINLIPGFGGTQRLVRLMAEKSRLGQKSGLLFAVDTILSAQPMSVEEACAHGLVSELVPSNSLARAYRLAACHVLGTDDTLRRAMEERHRAVPRWEEPLIDQDTGRPLDPSILTEDEHIKRYLRHAETVGRRGAVLRYALDLIVRNITEGVQYGEEAYYFGQAGASSEFRQSIVRFRNRVPLPRPPRRPVTEQERVMVGQLADESIAAARLRDAGQWEEPAAAPAESAVEGLPVRRTG